MAIAARRPIGAVKRRCMAGVPPVPADAVRNGSVRYLGDVLY